MSFTDVISMIRTAELEAVVRVIPGGKVLELGAGTGTQALALQQRGFEVVAVDLPTSDYAQDRVFPITEYDGTNLPFPDQTFDAVFSSNVMEHVQDVAAMNREIMRVLKPGGRCIHILPTHQWRAWTWLAGVPAAFKHLFAGRFRRLLLTGYSVALFRPHGEFPSAVHELKTFRPAWWREVFRRDGYEILEDWPVGFFYTGEALLGTGLTPATRQWLARHLGSSTHLFALSVRQHPDSA